MNPWSWRPSKDSWFQWLQGRALVWRPAEELGLDAPDISKRFMLAANANAEWLIHPCLNTLTAPQSDRRLERDLLAVAWLAAHVEEELGDVNIPHPLWVWSSNGGLAIPPGRRELAELGAQITAAQCPCSLPLDVWCRSLGFELPDSWASRDGLTTEEHSTLLTQITSYLRTVAVSDAAFPDMMAWITSVTSVAIALHATQTSTFRSGSHEAVPGMVYLDLFGGDLYIMEALVHESAHRHLYFAESAGPLVEPNHSERYASPLRPEPRPLRGILLAYHAIAYICSFYAEARQRRPKMAAVFDKELEPMLVKLDEAERTLDSAERHFTNLGRDFLENTRMVSVFARS